MICAGDGVDVFFEPFTGWWLSDTQRGIDDRLKG